MSFNKLTSFKISKDDIEIINEDLVKTASLKLPNGFNYDPDYLYLKVKAVSAGEYWGSNKNDDYFPEVELIKNYKTFLIAHTFKNHENKKIENAIGDVLSAEWSDRMKAVYLIIRIDKRIAPSVVRGYEKHFMTDVSMGCRVDHVICSYCGQKAKTRFDYCDHLKTMKGKIMDNGKKVYEINISPKFHDISAVLNGAERTAKVEGIYIENSKVALHLDNSLEKTASFKNNLEENNLLENLFKANEELNMEVIASSLKEDKKVSANDVVKTKNEINKSISADATSKLINSNHEIFEKISNSIKYNFTKYWDRNTCMEYGKILRKIAQESSVTPTQVFIIFLKILDACAIELSALEIHDIFFELFNFDSHDLRQLKLKKDENDINLSSEITNRIGVDNLGGSIKIIKSVRNMCENDGFGMFNSLGVPKLKALIIKQENTPFNFNSGIADQILNRIVSKVMQDRSNLRPHLSIRLQKIASGEIKESDNSVHFAPLKISMMEKCASDTVKAHCDMASLLYSAYQNDRVNSYNNGELEDNMNKIAYFIDDEFGGALEKVAGKKLIGRKKAMKASLMGFPLAMGYSGIQRSRINNGENISTFNRYIAENPINSALLATAGIGGGIKQINKNGKKVMYKIQDGANFVMDSVKKMKKVANEDIFNNKNIDVKMNEASYNERDLAIIKHATVLVKLGEEASAQSVLQKANLTFGDIDKYLKVASDCYKIELEKFASSSLKNLVNSVGSDLLLDNVKKGSALATLPGYVADGLIFTAIGKGLKKATNKKEGTKLND